MKFFDAHNHLQNFGGDTELEGALAEAARAGVAGMLCCGTSPEDWGRVLEIAGRYEGVTPCFGLHPWYAAEDGWKGRLEEFLRRAPAACVGECGLDGLKGIPGHEEDFKAQLDLAVYFNRPAVLHCVKSWGAMLAALKAARVGRFMLHSYSGPAELVPEFASLGGYFSFGGEIMDPQRVKLRKSLAAAPADRLLFETESPEPGEPPWRRGPAGVAEVAAAAAELLCRPLEELAALSLENAERFMGALK